MQQNLCLSDSRQSNRADTVGSDIHQGADVETTIIVAVVIVAGVAFWIWQTNESNKKVAARNDQIKATWAIERATALAAFERNEQPDIHAPNVVLLKGETVIWTQPAKLYEERVTSRKWEGGSKGISVPTGVMGIKVNFGKTQGSLNVERSSVPVATGLFVVTTRHLIFSGDSKSTKAPLVKLIDVQCADDGVVVSVTGRAKPWTVTFHDPMGGEVVRVAIQRAFDTQTA